jgi:hypothetical protein
MSWGAIAGAVAGVGASAYGASQQQQGQPGGIDVVTMPQYSGAQQNWNYQRDWGQNTLNALGRGEEVPWWAQYKKPIQAEMNRANYDRTMGTPGYRTGTVGAATEIGALTRMGGAPTARGVNKAMQDYATRGGQIDAAIAEMGANIASTSEGRALGTLGNLPMGPNAQAFPRNATAAPANQWGDIGGQLLGNIPYFLQTYPTSNYGSGGYGQMFGQDQSPYYSSSNNSMYSNGNGYLPGQATDSFLRLSNF